MIAPGVSSTISSTPVAVSSARMLRPSRPMIRPFMSSLGRSTTETVVSMACSAALRWMASAMISCARAAAVSRASVSSRLTMLAAPRRASASSCRSSSSRASSALSPATRCSSRWRSAHQLLGARQRRRRRPVRRSRGGLLAGAQLLLEPLGRGQAIGERAGLVGERLLEGEDFLLADRGPGLRRSTASSWARSRASSAASLRRVSASRSACRVTCSASARARSTVASEHAPAR